MELLKCEGLRVSYGKTCVIRDVSFSVSGGEFCALLGLNGSGKTTLLRSIAGLIKPERGDCFVAGRQSTSLNEKERAKLLSYVPQRHSTIYSTSVTDVVLMGFNVHLKLLESPGKAERDAVERVLDRVGLPGYGCRDFITLSEGQKQLVILARGIVQGAPVMLLDEPDSALDFVNRNHVLTKIRDLIHQEAYGGLITLHDPNFALMYCDRLILLKDGAIKAEIVMDCATRESVEEKLSIIYGDIAVLAYKDRFVMVKA